MLQLQPEGRNRLRALRGEVVNGRFSPVALDSHLLKNGQKDHYAIRSGGCGGRLLGRELNLTRDDCVEIIAWLEEAFKAGREENVEA